MGSYATKHDTFATRLANAAAPHLFTFLPHPHLEPTNNSAERMLRPVLSHARSGRVQETRRDKKDRNAAVDVLSDMMQKKEHMHI